MPAQRNYHGYVERLCINDRYCSGKLRGRALLNLIDQGVLRHIPPAQLAYDIARWGLDELSPSARQERDAFFKVRPVIPRPMLLERCEMREDDDGQFRSIREPLSRGALALAPAQAARASRQLSASNGMASLPNGAADVAPDISIRL
jgi:hypothetical protein